MPYKGNLGYLFYKDYYRKSGRNHFDPRKYPKNEEVNIDGKSIKKNQLVSDNNEKVFSRMNDLLLTYTAPNHLYKSLILYDETKNLGQIFKLKTTYPGFLTGSGYNHETGSKGEFKLGFFFDHTSGLPLLQSSGVKGVLRSLFPSYHLKKDKKTHQDERACFIWKRLNNLSDEYELANDERLFIFKLELAIFEGVDLSETLKYRTPDKPEFEFLKNEKNWKYLSIYQRDIFHDAVITDPGKEDKLFGDDYITPHIDQDTRKPNPFKDPKPIQFLKILPEVTFSFQFNLKKTMIGDRTITIKEKLDLFEKILLTLGAGAKTNVGYGQFKEVT